MNVYDFDKTIYDGDSSVHFYLYNLKKDFGLMRYLPRQLWAMIRYKTKRISKTEMKSVIYTYFHSIEDIDQRVLSFWSDHKKKIQPWYLKQKQQDDVIISASPTFLLQPICDELGVTLIASIVDKKTGQNIRENCYGQEKPIRFSEHFDLNQIDTFYSDSYSDHPMAQHAKQAMMVKKDILSDW